MILLALSLLVAVETHVLPRPEPDVTVVAPATAPQGVLEPPTIPPRIAQRMLGTIVVGSTVAVLVHTCAG